MNNWLPLKSAFDNRGQSYLYNVLNKAKEDLMVQVKQNKNKVNLLEIEQMLNNIFYTNINTDAQALVEQFQADMANETNKTVQNIISRFDLNKAARETPYDAKERVRFATFESTIMNTKYYIAELQKIMAQLSKGTQEYEHLAKVKSMMDNIVNKANIELQKGIMAYGLDPNNLGARQFSSNYTAQNKILELMNKMTAFNKAVNRGKNLNQKAIGSLFEHALAYGFKLFYDGSVSKVMQIIDSAVTGDDRVGRGGGYSSQKSQYIVDISTDPQLQNELIKQGFKIDENNLKATYSYDPRKETQGKLDVLIDFETGIEQNPIEQLRISAKNWIGGSNNLGTTSVDAALVRSVGENIASYYKLAVLNPSVDKFRNNQSSAVNWRAAQAAHELARVALASDIIMGLNQGQAGMANVLIINTGTSIRVFDIAKMVKNINKMSKASMDYNKTKIQNEAINYYRNIELLPGQGRTNRYYSTFTSCLNKMKISCYLTY